MVVVGAAENCGAPRKVFESIAVFTFSACGTERVKTAGIPAVFRSVEGLSFAMQIHPHVFIRAFLKRCGIQRNCLVSVSTVRANWASASIIFLICWTEYMTVE